MSGASIPIYVERRNRELLIQAGELNTCVSSRRNVELNSEISLPVCTPGLQQNRSVWLLIEIEIRSSEFVAKWGDNRYPLAASGEGPRQAILRPARGQTQEEHREQDSEN